MFLLEIFSLIVCVFIRLILAENIRLIGNRIIRAKTPEKKLIFSEILTQKNATKFHILSGSNQKTENRNFYDFGKFWANPQKKHALILTVSHYFNVMRG